MSRQIVNTGGQGLASSDGLKTAIGAIVAAAVVLLIFFFLNSVTKNRVAGIDQSTGSSMSAPAATPT